MQMFMTAMMTCLTVVQPVLAEQGVEPAAPARDMLTPRYYRSGPQDAFRMAVERMIAEAEKETFHHPLQDEAGRKPRLVVPEVGRFGAGKGPGGNKEHHPAVDFHVDEGTTQVPIHAAHDGKATAFRNVPKYRHALAIAKDVVASDGKKLGKLVTVYAHLDLDLDKAAGIDLNGKTVRKGDVISRHLYSRTLGGPHLHFEIRYYRAGDKGNEDFYGFRFPFSRDSVLTEKSAGPWSYGFWNPKAGYGFADPRNHGITEH